MSSSTKSQVDEVDQNCELRSDGRSLCMAMFVVDMSWCKEPFCGRLCVDIVVSVQPRATSRHNFISSIHQAAISDFASTQSRLRRAIPYDRDQRCRFCLVEDISLHSASDTG